MKLNQLVKYLGSDSQSQSIADPYWNNVLLLMRLDGSTNTKGLPFYKDYSKYQYHVRYREGTSNAASSVVKTVVNEANSGYPFIPPNSSTNVTSFTHLPNSVNRNARINEINAGLFNTTNPAYFDVRLNGNPSFELGNSDFTLELSFYAEDLNLPWKFQTLFTMGQCLYVNGGEPVTPSAIRDFISFPPGNQGSGYGLFIDGNRLKFLANNIVYNTYPVNLLTNTWYHVAIQRQGNSLKTFVNGELQTTLPFTSNLDTYYYLQESDPYFKSVTIGAAHTFSSYNATYGIDTQKVETAFSGGISNIRLTKNARYLSSFYTVTLPHPVNPVQNKIDADFSSTLFYMPCSYDYFDYSFKRAHVQNRELLKAIPKLSSHSLHLDGNTYKTKNINSNLDADNWCLEFYVLPYVNSIPLHLVNSPITASPGYEYNILSEKTWKELFFGDFQVGLIYGEELDENIPLIRITTAQKKKICDVDMRLQSRRYYNRDYNEGIYFAAKLSSNGDTWTTFPSEVGITVTSNPPSALPDEEIKFAGKFASNYGTDIESNSANVNGAYSQKRYHIAIQKTNQSIYFFINGVLNKTLSINTALYTEGNLELWIGGDYIPLTGRRTYYTADGNGTYNGVETNFALTLGLSGIRLTNQSRYSISLPNDIDYSNSFQPLPVSLSALPPARARIIDIIRESSNNLVSTQSVSWLVFANQDLDNISKLDFTVTSAEGLTGATVTSLTKLSTFQYRLVADVGTGNGVITPNFNDASTILYDDTATPISYYTGELSITGESYQVNKTRPSAILSSGSNPYINSKFLVYLQFDAPIATFDVRNIGIENAAITKHRPVLNVKGKYELEITPLTEGVINIKALPGTGIGDTALLSTASNTLTRVFKPFFPILQTPLNIGNGFLDISPTSALFTEVLPNSASFSTQEYAPGNTSALSISSIAEQSGLTCSAFNAVGGLLNVDNNIDWTIEFFLRINSTLTGTSKRAHIFSIENSLGFSLSASNGKLVIGRNPAQLTNLFTDVVFPDRVSTDYIEWSNPAQTNQVKFPHFAISKKGDTYRFYVNGKRVGISKNSTLFNLTKGKINIGYFPVNVNDVPYLLSNLRITYGKALYTSYEVNVPNLPYETVPNITDYAEILNYISVYSNNTNSNVGKAGDIITLKFSSIVTLPINPLVTIAGNSVPSSKEGSNYTCSYLVQSTDLDGTCPFSITIPTQLGIDTTVFTKTTNNSFVVIDNSALTVNLTSESTNVDSHVITLDVNMSEEVASFNLSSLSLLNCTASNLYKVPSSNNYQFTLTATSTGVMAVKVEANRLTDRAGNFNAESNTFTRSVTVPAYIPDSHWDNVSLLLQPTGNVISDSSGAGSQVVSNGVLMSYDNSPSGLSKSMYFNGSSSLETTGQSLNLTEKYTIELFLYVSSLTSIRLASPQLNPASNVSTKGFDLSWSGPSSAQYRLDIATDAAFINTLPGHKAKSLGGATSYSVFSKTVSKSPQLSSTVAIGPKGFILKWVDTDVQPLAYSVDVATNSEFTDRLTVFTDKVTSDNYIEVGDTYTSDIKSVSSSASSASSGSMTVSNVPARSGHILTGILKDGSGYPQLDYFLEESSIRLYGNDKYYPAGIAEDVELFKWSHVALVNNSRYTYLYMNGELVDRVRNISFGTNLVLGHSLGFFKGYMTGIRITKGVARYTGTEYKVPSLPYATS